MITNEDMQWAQKESEGFAIIKEQEIAYHSMLKGIEHERKRSGDECRKILQTDLPNELERMLTHEMANMIVGFPKAVIHCIDGDLELPIEQVGERHWRIKDGHE